MRHARLIKESLGFMKPTVFLILFLAAIASSAFSQDASDADAAVECASPLPPAFPERRPQPTPRDDDESMRPLPPTPSGRLPSARTVQAAPPPPDSADWLLRLMANSENPELRKRASEAWPVSEVFMTDMNGLVVALHDADPSVRVGAAQRLRALAPGQVFGYVMRTMNGGALERVRALNNVLPVFEPVIAPLMIETLRTDLETPLHRRIAAYCLGRMGCRSAIDVLAERAWSTDPELARMCVDALFAVGTPEAAPHWLKMLEHQDLHFQQLAVRALAAVGTPPAMSRLREIILDPAAGELGNEALKAMGALPPETAIPLLLDVLDADNGLRAAALRLLRAYAGEDFGPQSGPWREWWNAVVEGPPPPLTPAE